MVLATVLATFVASPAAAGETITNPYAPTRRPVRYDFSDGPPAVRDVEGVAFSELDAHRDAPATSAAPRAGTLPAGWVQQGGVVVPRAVAEGADVRTPGPTDRTDAGRPSAADKVTGPDASELCAFPEEVPAGVYTGEFVRGNEYPRHGTIYMNFVGGEMTAGAENSAENQSLLALNKSYPVYTGGEEKAVAVAQAVQADFADVAVRVVYLKRPPKRLPYVMIMMGGSYQDTTAGPSGGVAPGADCEDNGLRNVCYAFVNKDAINAQANVASQEIGHTMGLGHTFGSDRVMAFGYDAFSSIDMGFGGECTQVLTAAGQSGYCAGVNKCHCGSDGKQQHDVRTLRAIYAAPGPDMVAPTIAITAPPDGTIYEKGEQITVQLAPEDNFGGYGWELVIEKENGDVLAEFVDYDAAQEFTFGGLPAGTYRLVARVQDHADQVGEDVITIVIEGEEGAETGDPPTTSDSDGESSSDEGSGSETSPADGAEDGCTCTSRGPGGAAIGLLGLLGLRRRRSR